MREIVHIQAGQCGNQIGTKVQTGFYSKNQLLAGNKNFFRNKMESVAQSLSETTADVPLFSLC